MCVKILLHVKQKVGILALFQKSVLNSISQDEGKVALRWAEYQKFLAKADAIKGFKEEEYQDGFFKDVFENCLGYTLKTTNPSNFNLEREKKNETDGKKADGVIYVDGNIIGVVELKDQKTKQLDGIEAQAFNYHNSHSNSKYVIISNFDELRFYIDKKTAYESFYLFSLSYDEFKKLHLLLSFESIKDNIPQKLKDKSTNFEQTISKELYKDFTIFRTQLFENIIANNPAIDKSLLLRLTQKLCDRVIFILFAEDRALLRHNTIKEIREEFTNQRFTDYTLYDIYKFYFEGINTGNAKLNIPKYNGGLFATDELLDSLKIDDVCLNENAQKLSNYDFVSDISVNILGHIFEQSLSDLEELNASLNDLAFDKKNSKRKKDGVFYTPEYITRYIVENTLGKLCEEKKEALHVNNVEPPKNSKKPTKEEAQTKANLEHYKEWLLHVKVLDPACGSGAFLNQALEYLIKEHKELQEKLVTMGDITAYYEIEASILENNLYGVDINEDAVEIARLSLWLRTAQQGRALANLSDKIKCANSLLDMPFEENSFDVVIGNPPYVRNTALPKEDRDTYNGKYFVADGQYDLYILFNELALKLTKIGGLIGFIQPNKFLSADYGLKTLNFIFHNSNIHYINNVSLQNIFEDASVYPYIFIFEKKSFETNIEIKNISIFDSCKKETLIGFENQLQSIGIINKISKSSNPLIDYVKFIKRGVPNDKIEINLNGKYQALCSTDLVFPYTIGAVENKLDYKNAHFEQMKKIEFSEELILLPRTVLKIRAILNNSNLHVLDRIYYLALNEKAHLDIKLVLLILNSKITTFHYNYFYGSTKIGGGYMDLKGTQIATFPLPKFEKQEQQEPFIEKADLMLELNRQLQSTKQAFLTELNLEKIPQKLQNFEALEFEEFVKEYTKAKKIKFTDKLEERTFKQLWQSLFENDKTLTCKLKTEIAKTDKKIDAMVYELYGLSEDEIKIVEGI